MQHTIFHLAWNTVVLGILLWLGHWIFDFVFQRNVDAVNKWKSFPNLLFHTVSYSLLWMFYLVVTMGFANLLFIYGFVATTFFAHTVQDYFTSKITHYLYEEALKKKNFKNFFIMIGFDQFLHYVQIVLTWYFFQHLIIN